MNQMTIRPAEKKDIPQIAKVHVETWRCAYRGQMPDALLDNVSIEQRAKRWEKILSNPTPDSQTFVAELDSKVVGFCSVGLSLDKDLENTGELLSLYIGSNYMNKGVGTALFEKGLRYIKDQGYTKAILWVLTSNGKARQWYEKKGWVMDGKTKIEKRDGFELHETRYQRDL